MSKEETRLTAIFGSPRTYRSMVDAFGIIVKSAPRDLGNGCFLVVREGFSLRFHCDRNSVKVYGASASLGEFLWFDGRLAGLPKGMKTRATACAVKALKPASKANSIYTVQPTSVGGSRLSYPPWFKEKQAAKAKQIFLGHAGAQRQQTRSTPSDAMKMGGSPGHPTDNE